MPGTLPVINRKAVEYTIMTALALNCGISPHTRFDRKNYPYPDLMKGYQISQYDAPISSGGYLEFDVGVGAGVRTRRVGITRVHMEEDVAKLQHVKGPAGKGEQYSLVDANRSGVPLMEVVGEPDIRSPEEARRYLVSLRSILQYLGVSTGNMQDGSFRCDANVSIRPAGSSGYMPRVEVKNMNSFRAVYAALKYEIERQTRVVEDGGTVAQETRGWVEERNVTVPQRSKEYAHDYRYFPEPDLPPLAIDPAWVDQLRRALPELPGARRARFVAQYGLPLYDADLLTASRRTADYFEGCVGLKAAPPHLAASRAKTIANWILGELGRLLSLNRMEIGESRVTPAHLVELVELVESETLSTTLARTVLEECFSTGKAPSQVAAEGGYAQISDPSVVERAVRQAIEASPRAVSDYLKGKETAAKFIVGQAMKLTSGKARPGLVNELVRKKLESMRMADVNS
jgi:aspartyl-tRNA(Asn)/glutamyl-tRNA(Gln) amidotransferase subunit B